MEHRPHYAIVLFGGSGDRFQSKLPKQFLKIGGKPLMTYCLDALQNSPEVDTIILASKPGYEYLVRDLCLQYHYTKVKSVVSGGQTRQESVYRCLNFLSGLKPKRNSLVLIHDGDRPKLTETMIQESFVAAAQFGAAVTAIPATDSILLSRGKEVEDYLPRDQCFQVQTPQTFAYPLILKAHQAARDKNRIATDDGSLVLALGHRVHLVPGSVDNIKITTREDAVLFVQKEKKAC